MSAESAEHRAAAEIAISAAKVGVPWNLKKLLDIEPFRLAPWMTSELAMVEKQSVKQFGMCPWCGQPLEGHLRRCENDD